METNVSIIGCGAVIHNIYRRALCQLERTKLIKVAALVDDNHARASALQRFFPGASLHSSVADAIRASRSQLTIVATPPRFHSEHSIQAMTAGSNVLCEKPMATTRIECREMNEVARQTGRRLMIGMPRRYYPALCHARELIANERLGTIRSFVYREGRIYNWPVANGDMFKRVVGGGGVLLDIGSHVFDTLSWLIGKPAIVSYRDDSMVNGVEASCVAKVDVDGVSGMITLSWDSALVNELVISGTGGELLVNLDRMDRLAINEGAGWQQVTPAVSFPANCSKLRLSPGAPASIVDCVMVQIVQALQTIERGDGGAVDGLEGEAVIDAIEACYDMAEPLNMPWLPDLHNRAFQQLHWRKQWNGWQ